MNISMHKKKTGGLGRSFEFQVEGLLFDCRLRGLNDLGETRCIKDGDL